MTRKRSASKGAKKTTSSTRRSDECEPACYLDADRRRKSLHLKAASYEFLVTIRRRLTLLRATLQHALNHRRLSAGVQGPLGSHFVIRDKKTGMLYTIFTVRGVRESLS
jgi:hypothetical protein